MKLTLGFSPCPNDTFIFDAMIHNRIDTEGLQFEAVMEDVEALNQKAFASQLDITKLSYHAYAHLTSTYVLLDSGSALGNNCGPLLISKEKVEDLEKVKDMTIAIPGKYTTANFLLGYTFPHATQLQEMLFSDIEQAVLDNKVDAGVIIHENRFTYAQKGLQKIMDLGEHWEQSTQMPIPLGGIVVKRTLPLEVQQTVNRVLQRSVQYAFDHPEASKPFVQAHAQEMEEAVMQQHIALYVNTYTLDLGEKGRAAVQHLFDKAIQYGKIPEPEEDLFL